MSRKSAAPESGRVTNKSVESETHLQVGQPIFAIVPQTVWVTANFKETSADQMRPQPIRGIDVDAIPHAPCADMSIASRQAAARASLLPPETRLEFAVVQRVPVKIALDEQPDVKQVLGPGMSGSPDVKVKSGIGPAISVTLIALLAIGLVSGAAICG
mgnify:CR=1 FL=1